MDRSINGSLECEPDMRSNTDVEFAVTRGIAAALLHGESEGVRIMMNEGVPNEIISRVLHNETKRRSTDWKSCKQC